MKPSIHSYPEEKISDGIYMTDFRKKPPTIATTNGGEEHSPYTMMEEYENLLATTQYELKELNSKIFHLERSNHEMKEIMNESGQDEDLVLAISENEEILVKFKRRVELIHERLAHLQCLQSRVEFKKQEPAEHLSVDDLSDDIDQIML